MAKIFWRIWLLVVLLWWVAYSWMINWIIEVISNFNSNVVVFIPSELLFIFWIIWFWLAFKIYQAFK